MERCFRNILIITIIIKSRQEDKDSQPLASPIVCDMLCWQMPHNDNNGGDNKYRHEDRLTATGFSSST